MIKLLKAMFVVILQQIPFINKLNFVQNSGTVAGALVVINKALDKLEKVEIEQAEAAAVTERSIEIMQSRREAQVAESLAAAKVSKNLKKLTQ